ncbi:Adenylate kinase isoenzyme 6 [Kalmanozyma brasiliensis GHG001]|uniref:Adenylate kinase isoenzyme 6 homolog n=1 Tax=Kalmanozyma brasiliensis (strain GHG001) TaxID=1365824 RepID=V5F269_KALBG|nr:Adenylate kinase isoenzyme 6 [Kalmanozyma brasiliensis GHG001]EST09474.1 Adenylate kinase isoenzyme 6 [Kalmanozyma brasiliensis GHG001]
MVRSYPNIVITGTPGTGKSTHSSLLASTYSPPSSSSHPLRQIDVGALVKQEGFYTDYLEEWQSYEVNEDQLLDHLEPLTGTKAPEPIDGEEFDEDELRQAKQQDEDDEARGGLVLDWHTCDVWPERWADLVVVLRCDHSVLWERLEKRGYPLKKIQENNEAEIMGVVADDARSSYPAEAVVELTSQESGDVEENVERIIQWIHAWRQARGLE